MGRGRPKGNGSGLNKTIVFRSDDALYNTILQYGKIKGLDISDAIRGLISIGAYKFFVEDESPGVISNVSP